MRATLVMVMFVRDLLDWDIEIFVVSSNVWGSMAQMYVLYSWVDVVRIRGGGYRRIDTVFCLN